MASANMVVVLSAKNEASKAIKQFSKELKNLGNELEQKPIDVGALLDLNSLQGKLAAFARGGLWGLAGAAGLGGLAAAGKALDDLAVKADRLRVVRSSFDDLAASANQDSQKMLQALRRASYGMVNDSDLILAANKAMILGVADSAEELTDLLEIARVRGEAMGLSLQQAFNDIVTGLGRESALILDNLGITIDTERAMADYARTLGKTADQLDSVQRKQALVNAVIAQSAGLKAAPPSGVTAAHAQAEVAREQAAEALGALAARPSREWAQMQADALNQLAGRYDAVTWTVRELDDLLTDLQAGEFRMSDESVRRITAYRDALIEVRSAAADGITEAETYLTGLSQIAFDVLSRGVTDQQLNVINLAVSATRDAVATRDAHRQAMQYEGIYLQQIRDKQAQAAKAAEAMATAERLAADATTAMNAAMSRAGAAVDAIRAKLVSAATAGMGAAKAFATFQQYSDLGQQVEQLRQGLSNLGYYTPQEIDFLSDIFIEEKVLGVERLIDEFKDLGKEGVKSAGAIDSAFDSLKSRIGGVLSESLSLDPIGVNPADFLPRADAVQEDAFRLADVMVRGFESPWADYFKNTFPDLFEEITAGGDIQAGAARILQEFQAGLRPELLNKETVKERVRRLILGEQSMAQLGEEIAQELAGELGVSLQQAQGAVAGVLGPLAGGESAGAAGGASGTEAGKHAGSTFAVGFVAAVDGAALGAAVAGSIEAQFALKDISDRLRRNGESAGQLWVSGFTASAGNIPAAIVDILVSRLLPLMIAAQANQSSLTMPQ